MHRSGVFAVCLLALLFAVELAYPQAVLPLRGRQTSLLSRRAAQVGQSIHLTGNLNVWGEYFASVGLGTPPQYLNLQIDTGSTDLIAFAADCSGCGKRYAYYDSSKSSTAGYVDCGMTDYTCTNECSQGMGNCNFDNQYGDGSSISGSLAKDVLVIGNFTTQGNQVVFGAINNVDAPNGFEATGVDGIMGFAFQSLSSWTGPSVFDTLYETYNFYDGFSMCLRPQGGALSLGVDYSKDPNFKWTEISQEQWYNVEINDIKVGNQSIGLSWYDLNWNSVIVDSGTTLLILPSDIFAAVQKQFVALCSRGVNLPGVCNSPPKSQNLFQGACIPLTAQQVQLFPTFSINFPGIGDLPIQPIDYLWQGAGVPNTYCLGLYMMDGLGVIIGDIFMQRYHVAFDKNLDRIGFAPITTCPTI